MVQFHFKEKKMHKWLYALPLLALVWGHQAKAADVEAGKAKAVVCAACHGIDGKASVASYPHLAGQNAAYLAKQMEAFRDGDRKEPLMAPFMAMLSDADIDNLAAYYASLK
jgi:cytochrome c553